MVDSTLSIAKKPADLLQTDMASLIDQANQYAAQARAAATRDAYRTDWRIYTTWCAEHGLPALPPSGETIALFITDQSATHTVATLRRYLATISAAAQAAGHPPISTRLEPLKSIWAGIRRVKGVHQEGKAAAVFTDVRRMVATCDRPEGTALNRLIDVRDRALLLVGFASACRRSELVALDAGDVRFTADGAVLAIRRSKTDQEGAGVELPIPWGSHPDTCPVRALKAWLDASGIQEGSLWRSINRHGQLQPGRLSDRAVALIVKARAEKAGLDPTQYAGHSLRSGHVTTAAANNVPEHKIMNQTRHKSLTMVRRYIRRGNLFQETSATSLGL